VVPEPVAMVFFAAMTGYRFFAAGTLGEPWTSRIASASKSHGQGSAVTQGNLGGQVGIGIVGLVIAAFGIWTGTMTHTVQMGPVIETLIGVALIALSVFLIRRRLKSTLGTFTLSTPAYYIESDGGQLKVWNRALAVGIRFHHNYHRGIYASTTMIFEYPTASLGIGDFAAPIDADEQLLAMSAVFREHLYLWKQAKGAMEAGAFARLPGAELIPDG
jgi:hypothetical protein